MDDDKERRLTEIAEHLDISPTDYARAQGRFHAVKNWLEEGAYHSGADPQVYLQGSFRLGTVVRPYRGDSDGDFDIDQVCELAAPARNREPGLLKNDIGDRLKENGDYERMLDDEGRRCWTLIYASEENRPGFHLDVLPALPSGHGEAFQIDITQKSLGRYDWLKSNPNGYYYWFKAKNYQSGELIQDQRRRIFSQNRALYGSEGDVPLQLVRSPLQRGIQLMKRHRDVSFAENDSKPISIIITTIAAHRYTGASIFSTIKDFTTYVKDRHNAILKNGQAEFDGVLDYIGNTWSVPNPIHHARLAQDIENFADKWNEDPTLPAQFFDWVYQLDRDLRRFEESGISDDLELRVKKFGTGSTYRTLQLDKARVKVAGQSEGTNELLDLIHLGIEGRIDWDPVKEIAQSIYDQAEAGDSKDVAAVNFYQIARHRGIALAAAARADVHAIMARHPNSAAYRMCGNLLLGTATRAMISECLQQGAYFDVLSWPILRLAAPEALLPPQ